MDVLVGGYQQPVVCLQAVGPRNIVVWAKGAREAVDVGCELRVVLGPGEALVLFDLWLHAPVPLHFGESLHLLHARGAVLLRIRPARSDDSLVDSVVVGTREVDVRRGINVVIGLDMGHNGVFEAKVGLANAW